jgi:hypothetical protein
MFSSTASSLEARLIFLSVLSYGKCGGEEDGIPGGVTDRRDFFDVLDGVRYGVPAGVGSDAAAALPSSFSVSQTDIAYYAYTPSKGSEFGWSRKLSPR